MKNNVNQLISLLYSNSIARVKINQPKLGIFPKVLELDVYIKGTEISIKHLEIEEYLYERLKAISATEYKEVLEGKYNFNEDQIKKAINLLSKKQTKKALQNKIKELSLDEKNEELVKELTGQRPKKKDEIKKAANKIIADCKVELKDLSYKDMSNEEFLYKDCMFYSKGGEYFFREDDVSVVYLDGFIFHLDDKNLIFSNNFREVL